MEEKNTKSECNIRKVGIFNCKKKKIGVHIRFKVIDWTTFGMKSVTFMSFTFWRYQYLEVMQKWI